MKPTAKHNDEELREAMASLEWAMANDNSLTQHQKECLRTVLASLESARADTRRLDWLERAGKRIFSPLWAQDWIHIRAAIDRAATSAEGEA